MAEGFPDVALKEKRVFSVTGSVADDDKIFNSDTKLQHGYKFEKNNHPYQCSQDI